MRLILNGEEKELAGVDTVAALVEQLQLNATQVAIERNRVIVPRATYGQAALSEGDEIEIVRFIGGG
ncbi:MAG: sulfur carrier protein ThiS [Alphaproteobacteria bacterium]